MSGPISHSLRRLVLGRAALKLRPSPPARHLQTASNRVALLRESRTHWPSRNARPRQSAFYSTTPSPSESRSSPFLTALLCLGVGAVAYGIYDLYGTLTMWPSELRNDLRDGISAKNSGDFETSARYLYRAWQTSKTLPLASFRSQPLLKTTGIAICLGEVLEQDNQPQAAYEIYAEALGQIHQHAQTGEEASAAVKLTGPEELRAISLAHKLGELSIELGRPTAEQEKYLTEAAERLLKSTTITTSVTTIKSQPPVPAEQQQEDASFSSSSPPLSSTGEQYQVTGNKGFLEQPLDGEAHATVVELGLPEWATTVDFAAPLSSLAAFYGSNGKPEYAMPLYLHAISVLIPPSPKTSSPADRCRGAQMMNSLAELIMRTTLQPGPTSTTQQQQQQQQAVAALHQAETWIRKALEVTAATRKSLGPNQMEGDCEIALASSLFNAGLLRELHNDPAQAKKFYTSSMEQFKRIGFKEGVEVNEDAIRRMAGGSQTSA